MSLTDGTRAIADRVIKVLKSTQTQVSIQGQELSECHTMRKRLRTQEQQLSEFNNMKNRLAVQDQQLSELKSTKVQSEVQGRWTLELEGEVDMIKTEKAELQTGK